MSKLTVQKINKLNILVIKQEEENEFFTATPRAIVISIESLSFLLNFLVNSEYLSDKVLKGILSEYNTNKG